MTQHVIRKVGQLLSSEETSTSSAVTTSTKESSDNKIQSLTVIKSAETIRKKPIQPLSATILETLEDEDIKCVRTNNLTKFKALSAPTPQATNNEHHDFRLSDSNSSTTSPNSNKHHPISHLYIQSSADINNKTFKLLPFELIFDLIFPFLCLPEILQFSSSCKLFQSYIFHIIEPNDSMWRQQLQNTIPFLNQLTNKRILEMNNRTKGLNSVQHHQALIMQGVLQEYIVRVKRRIQYFEGISSDELSVKHSNSSTNKVFSIPPHYRNNTATAVESDVSMIVESIVGADYEGFFELGEEYSIRKCVISICSGFLREIQPFSLEHVHIHEFYDPSQFNTTLKKKNSFKKLLKHHSLKNLTLSPSENSESQHYFDNESYRHQLLNETQNEETLTNCRMTIVGCSERAVHPCILQTFRKNQFPVDYISNYGRNFSSFASIRNMQTNVDELFKLKLVDMPTDAWNSNDTSVYLKPADTAIVIFNRRYKSSFEKVCNQIIPSIRKSATNAKIILVGIDWLHALLGSEQYESLRYKLSVDELLKLEPISYSKVIRKCSKIHFKKKDKKDLQPPIMAYIEFTPKDQNIANDISKLMDIILKLRVGTSKGIDFFSPHVSNRPSSKLNLFKRNRNSTTSESLELTPPQPHIFSNSQVTSMSHNQLFKRKKSIKLKLKSLFSF